MCHWFSQKECQHEYQIIKLYLACLIAYTITQTALPILIKFLILSHQCFRRNFNCDPKNETGPKFLVLFSYLSALLETDSLLFPGVFLYSESGNKIHVVLLLVATAGAGRKPWALYLPSQQLHVWKQNQLGSLLNLRGTYHCSLLSPIVAFSTKSEDSIGPPP